MNRKIILLPLALGAILALAACNPTTTTSSATTSEGGIVPDSSTTVSSATAITYKAATISEVKTAGYYEIKGVVTALTAKGYMLADAGGAIYVYLGSAPSVTKNSYVDVKAYAKINYGVWELVANDGNNITATALTTTAPTLPTATALTAEIANGWIAATWGDTEVLKTTDVKPYTFVAKAIQSGDYINLTMEGVTKNISAVSVTSEFALTANKSYTMVAYPNGYNSKNSYIPMVYVSATEYVATPTSITISGPTSVQATATITLTAAVTPSDAAQDVVWSSADETIATVTAAGVVTGVKEGAVKIKATAKDVATVYAEYDVTVTAAPTATPTGITVSVKNAGDDASIEIGTTVELMAAVAPSDALQSVVWSSSNENVATVDAAGVVTGVLDGKATITATAKDVSTVSGTFEITVTNAGIKSISEVVAAVAAVTTNYGYTEKMTTKGVLIAKLDAEKTYLLSDGTKALEISKLSDTLAYSGIAVGDYVEITATFQKRYTMAQAATISLFAKAQTADKPTIGSAVSTSASAFETLAKDSTTFLGGQYISVSNARLSKVGTAYRLNVDGTTYQGYASATDGFTMPAEGVWGTFTAYVVSGFSGNGLTIWINGFTKNAAVAATGVTVSSDAATMQVGETMAMSATVTPTLSDQIVTWSVEDSAGNATTLATISADGVLSATAAGTVVVRATSAVTTTVSGTKAITITTPKSYDTVATYTFPTASSDGAAYTDASALALVQNSNVLSGTQAITAVSQNPTGTTASKTYAGVSGVKFSTTSAIGGWGLTLDSAKAIQKVVVTVIAYNTSGVAVAINGNNFYTADNTKAVPFTLESDTVISALTIMSAAKNTVVGSNPASGDLRFYMSSLTLFKLSA